MVMKQKSGTRSKTMGGECWTFFNLHFLDQEWGKYLESALQNWEDSANVWQMHTIQTVMSTDSTVLLLSAKTKQENQCNEASRLSENVSKMSSALSHKNMEKSPCKLNLLHCRQNHDLFVKENEKGIGTTRKIWSQANSTWYNTQGWDMKGGGGGMKWRDSGRKGGGAAPLCQLISEPGGMVWQCIYFSTLIKKGLLLTVIRIQGTAETRRCDAVAVRSQVITLNPALTVHALYQPLPPPYQLRPLFLMLRSLSPTLLILHVVHMGVPK